MCSGVEVLLQLLEGLWNSSRWVSGRRSRFQIPIPLSMRIWGEQPTAGSSQCSRSRFRAGPSSNARSLPRRHDALHATSSIHRSMTMKHCTIPSSQVHFPMGLLMIHVAARARAESMLLVSNQLECRMSQCSTTNSGSRTTCPAEAPQDRNHAKCHPSCSTRLPCPLRSYARDVQCPFSLRPRCSTFY